MEDKEKYMSLTPIQSQENTYETINVKKDGDAQSIQNKASKQSTWSTPLALIALLLCLIVFLLVIILCLSLVQLFAKDATSTSTATAGAIASSFATPNFTEWANGVVSKVNQRIPDFDQWANGVAQNTFQLLQSSPNFTELDKQILQTTKDSAQKLINIVNTLSKLEETSTSTAGVVDDILLIAQELLVLHNDSTVLPTSCKQLKSQYPSSPSGYYVLASACNSLTTNIAYCNMEELCGSGGGWTRLAHLNMTNSKENCPSGFRLYQSGGVRACGRATSSGGSCVSVQFPSNGISYSQVCGRVMGYQFGSTDANPHQNNLNSYYIDGVSITRGSPRQHVWTLLAGLHEAAIHSHGQFNCPCANGSLQNPTLQSLAGNDYFCESGNPATADTWQYSLYASDPLWDGEGCGNLEGNCCTSRPSLPWFNKVLNTTTTDYLELRVCGDEGTADEDTPVSFYELYVK